MKKETLKRAAALSMASMMVLSLAACGGQETRRQAVKTAVPMYRRSTILLLERITRT